MFYLMLSLPLCPGLYEPRHEKILAYAKTKVQFSCAVTAQLISAFVLATQKVLFLFYLKYSKFQAFFCYCAGQFVSDLIANLEDQFSRVVAHLDSF